MENWTVSDKIKAITNKELAKEIYKAADGSSRENMGQPDEYLVEAAHRLNGGQSR